MWMCFVVFCGCFVIVCGCFAVLCECFAVFPQNTQNTRKTSKNTEKHKNLTIRPCIVGVFQEQKNSTVLHKTPFTKHLQNTAKHRKTVTKRVLWNTSQNTAKRTQNARKRHKTLTIQPQYVLRAFGVFSQKYARSVAKAQNTQYTRKLRGGGTYPQRVT